MKVAFAGTPEFARVALQAVHAADHELVLVLTQPDRPAGRGLRLQASAVKHYAIEHGLALAQPGRRVLAVVGDGEMMMGLGSLATVAVQRPRNLSIVVVDNEHYAETGMQRAHTGRGVDLVAVARAVGFGQRIALLVGNAPGELAFVAVKVGTEPAPMALPPRDGPYLRSRFREHLLGAAAHE